MDVIVAIRLIYTLSRAFAITIPVSEFETRIIYIVQKSYGKKSSVGIAPNQWPAPSTFNVFNIVPLLPVPRSLALASSSTIRFCCCCCRLSFLVRMDRARTNCSFTSASTWCDRAASGLSSTSSAVRFKPWLGGRGSVDKYERSLCRRAMCLRTLGAIRMPPTVAVCDDKCNTSVPLALVVLLLRRYDARVSAASAA